jgi:hypothetical protein
VFVRRSSDVLCLNLLACLFVATDCKSPYSRRQNWCQTGGWGGVGRRATHNDVYEAHAPCTECNRKSENDRCSRPHRKLPPYGCKKNAPTCCRSHVGSSSIRAAQSIRVPDSRVLLLPALHSRSRSEKEMA